MKELTIEEKAKAYDEAIERAREWYNDLHITFGLKGNLEDIFPELKESEDEKVREALIELVKCNERSGYLVLNNVSTGSMLAWLEKQGEQKDVFPIPTRETVLAIWELGNKWKGLTEGSIFEIGNQLEYIQKHWQESTYYLTVKQSEQKSADEVEPRFHEGDLVRLKDGDGLEWTIKEMHHDGYYTIVCEDREDFIYLDNRWELVGKLVDKNEPKFHEGEWIINSQGTLRHIINVDKGGYQTDGGWLSHDAYEKTFHLWTIEDAKDGDVLVYGDNPDSHHVKVIMLFKAQRSEYSASTYFHIFKNKYRVNDWCDCGKSAHPATKSQRDTLFAKMKEAGYEWNPQKKELKKIELTKIESEEELSDFEAALFSAFSDGWQQYLHGEEVDVAQWTKEHSAELLEAAKQNPVVWSEEDEEMLVSIISDFAAAHKSSIGQDKWLKSLKYRVWPQPKHEWSKEDEKKLNLALYFLNESKQNAPEEFENYGKQLSKKDYEDVVNWLKSLKERYAWKPSSVQIECLYDAINHYHTNGYPASKLNELYEQLSKIYKL